MPPIVSTDRWQPELLGGEFHGLRVSVTHLRRTYYCISLLLVPPCCLSTVINL